MLVGSLKQGAQDGSGCGDVCAAHGVALGGVWGRLEGGWKRGKGEEVSEKGKAAAAQEGFRWDAPEVCCRHWKLGLRSFSFRLLEDCDGGWGVECEVSLIVCGVILG